jgi:hypothetical protein
LRQGKRQVARAAADIERPLAGSGARQFDDAPFPTPMQAETLKIVDQVVARAIRVKRSLTLAARWSPGSKKVLAMNKRSAL